MKDLKGQKFGKLTVLERDLTKTGGAAYWICQCECGKIKSIRGSNLTAKNKPTRSCGCLNKGKNVDTTSLLNQRFGRLTVIERDLNNIGHNKNSYWKCLCDCGNTISVSRQDLINKHTQSCGCYRKEYRTQQNTLDLTNRRYGLLVALENTKQQDKRGCYIWKCQCDCGNIVYLSSEKLQAGHANSCGCAAINSLGEQKIKQILDNANINYIPQYTFNDCRNPKTNNLLYFDFAIFNKDNTLNRLIEYDGIQHYKPIQHFRDSLEEIQFRDKIKNIYCQQHNLKLIRIPYFNYKDIDIKMIME